MTETYLRTLVRTVLYRIIAMAITAVWTGLGTAVTIHLILAAVQFVYERFWLNIDWELK